MEPNQQHRSVLELIYAWVKNEYLYFDTPVKVKASPHQPAVHIWGTCISPDEHLYVMDAEQNWNLVAPNESLIVSSLFQRLKIMERKYGKAILASPTELQNTILAEPI